MKFVGKPTLTTMQNGYQLYHFPMDKLAGSYKIGTTTSFDEIRKAYHYLLPWSYKRDHAVTNRFLERSNEGPVW